VSKIIASAAIKGAHKIVERAEKKYEETIKSEDNRMWDSQCTIPTIICAILGVPIQVGDKPVLDRPVCFPWLKMSVFPI
jgi:hypothetical protein